eukprot:15471792-Alexandrium_andersonii.AAC.1
MWQALFALCRWPSGASGAPCPPQSPSSSPRLRRGRSASEGRGRGGGPLGGGMRRHQPGRRGVEESII